MKKKFRTGWFIFWLIMFFPIAIVMAVLHLFYLLGKGPIDDSVDHSPTLPKTTPPD